MRERRGQNEETHDLAAAGGDPSPSHRPKMTHLVPLHHCQRLLQLKPHHRNHRIPNLQLPVHNHRQPIWYIFNMEHQIQYGRAYWTKLCQSNFRYTQSNLIQNCSEIRSSWWTMMVTKLCRKIIHSLGVLWSLKSKIAREANYTTCLILQTYLTNGWQLTASQPLYI